MFSSDRRRGKGGHITDPEVPQLMWRKQIEIDQYLGFGVLDRHNVSEGALALLFRDLLRQKKENLNTKASDAP